MNAEGEGSEGRFWNIEGEGWKPENIWSLDPRGGRWNENR